MHIEISTALNFIMNYLYNKLPRRRVDVLLEDLERTIKRKFDGHWYPEKPFKGSAFRCLRLTGEQKDSVLDESAANSGLSIAEINEYLPQDLTIWIDPGEVSYCIGERGNVKVLYSTRDEPTLLTDREVEAVNNSRFSSDVHSFKPIDSVASSFSHLSISQSPQSNNVSPLSGQTVLQNTTFSTPPPSQMLQFSQTGHPTQTNSLHSPVSNIHPLHNVMSSLPQFEPDTDLAPQCMASFQPVETSSNTAMPSPKLPTIRARPLTMMTTAMFAQTKFGSTKLKSQPKRPNRLSPTELGINLKQPQHTAYLPSPTVQVIPTFAITPSAITNSPLDPHYGILDTCSNMIEPRYAVFGQQKMIPLIQQYTISPSGQLSPRVSSPATTPNGPTYTPTCLPSALGTPNIAETNPIDPFDLDSSFNSVSHNYSSGSSLSPMSFSTRNAMSSAPAFSTMQQHSDINQPYHGSSQMISPEMEQQIWRPLSPPITPPQSSYPDSSDFLEGLPSNFGLQNMLLAN